MSAVKVNGITWQEVTVLLRSDILKQAREQHLDIGDECNAALALRSGIAYTNGHPKKSTHKLPVIIAADTAPAVPVLRPVINADDPTTPAKVLREKANGTRPKTPAVHPPMPTGAPVPVVPTHPPEPAKGKPRKPAVDKKQKGNAIKKFVSSRIIRADDDNGSDAVIPKDELYQRFEDWCKDHAITVIPDRRQFTVALKNQYVIAERVIGGTPYWVNIRMK
ncbi:MAG: hypothetical protein NTZ39_03420 [Methanoregula sp.]|nr:hypothetical protein [Methanoregula sp.]